MMVCWEFVCVERDDASRVSTDETNLLKVVLPVYLLELVLLTFELNREGTSNATWIGSTQGHSMLE